jgi:hypothetical protein
LARLSTRPFSTSKLSILRLVTAGYHSKQGT